jgi:hypothetical protein
MQAISGLHAIAAKPDVAWLEKDFDCAGARQFSKLYIFALIRMLAGAQSI